MRRWCRGLDEFLERRAEEDEGVGPMDRGACRGRGERECTDWLGEKGLIFGCGHRH